VPGRELHLQKTGNKTRPALQTPMGAEVYDVASMERLGL